MEKFRQPDGLRGLLTLFVVAAHWLPRAFGPQLSPHMFRAVIVVAETGMYFFFVLSGFLITGILVRNRIKGEASAYPKKQIWKNYFIRRCLRIFPIYFLTWFVLDYFNVLWIRNNSVWHLSYLSNVYFYKVNQWKFGGHLWSLSAEEQFYLIWPLLMLFVPLRYLKRMVLALVLIAPLFRMVMNSIWPSQFTEVLTPALLDGLGLGALLALEKIAPSRRLQPIARIGLPLAGIFSALLIVLFEWKPFGLPAWNEFSPFYEIFRRSSMAVLGLFLVHGSVKGFPGMTGRFLETRVLLFLGKISYALYLFHNFQPYLMEWFKVPIPMTGVFVLLQLAILIAAATLSWYLIEQPLNNLKKYFPYVRRSSVVEPVAIAATRQ